MVFYCASSLPQRAQDKSAKKIEYSHAIAASPIGVQHPNSAQTEEFHRGDLVFQ